MLKIIFLLLFSISAYSSELKHWPAPDCSDEPQTKVSRYSQSPNGKVDPSNLTIMGINVPMNSMKDIDAPFPEPLISNDRPGCASCSDYACFISEDKSTALIFYRYTAWDLSAFEMLKINNNNTPNQCAQTSIDSANIVTQSGIKIGSSKSFVSKALDIKNAEGKILFQYQNKLKHEDIVAALQWSKSTRPPECKHFYSDATTEVVVEYDESGLSKFKIGYMESL